MHIPSDRIEHIRLRPGMYIGNPEHGAAHLVWELVSNAVDEHLAGCCSTIAIEIQADGRVVVDDDGGGIPLDLVEGMRFPELALTRIHATPTRDGDRLRARGGRHCVGLVVVNALSARLELDIFRDGRRHALACERGRLVMPLHDAGPTDRKGTRIGFMPDGEILGGFLDAGALARKFRDIARLLPGLTLRFADRREFRFHEPRGLVGFLEIARGATAGPVLSVDALVGGIRVEAAARWDPRGWPSDIRSYANMEPTTGGGSHVRGLMGGLVAGLRQAMPELCRGQRAPRLASALSAGLRAVISVRLQDARYEGATRDCLSTPAAESAVRSCAAAAFADFVPGDSGLQERLRKDLEQDR